MIWWSDDYNCALKISVFDDDGIEFFIWQQVYWISSDSSEKQAVKNGRPLLQTMADLPNVTIIKQQRLDNRATSIYSIMLEATESLFTLRIKKPKWLILGPLRKIESNKQHQCFFPLWNIFWHDSYQNCHLWSITSVCPSVQAFILIRETWKKCQENSLF